MSSEILPEGIPSINEYNNLLLSDIFSDIEFFSNSFISKYDKIMKGYDRKWASGSIHLWSRQWEYPFAFFYIDKDIRTKKEKSRILDAGSGLTFFPYYLTKKLQEVTVYCSDNDASLGPKFKKINLTKERVQFNVNDLSRLSYDSDFFDVIYCISVLEHLKDFEIEKILQEFKRVLRNNGLIVLTFDISLDNNSRISIEGAKKLLETLSQEFRHPSGLAASRLQQDLERKDILTTSYVRDRYDKKLLPWRPTIGYVINQIVRLQVPKKPFFDLTVFCSVWQNSKCPL
jgi:ubiquinone/menaquinone biosynthesis C-methylase UbiE